MSSTLRTVAQIPARVKYLVCVSSEGSSTNNLLDVDCFSFTCPEGTFPESLIDSNTAAGVLGITGVGISAGQLFKDLGRQIVICDSATHLHSVVYREVQLVNDAGAGDEGVPDNYPISQFVRVWSADGQGVRVARVGPGAH